MEVEFIASPNFGYGRGSHGRNGNPILAIVCHIAEGSREGCISWFQNPASYASSNYLVNRDGSIVQFVADGDSAWANGKVDHPDLTLDWLATTIASGVNVNEVVLSCEHEGWSGEPLTEEQYQATLALHRQLVATYGIPVDADHITGHFSIDSVNRANCPGPAFPFERLRADLAGGDEMTAEQKQEAQQRLDEMQDLYEKLTDGALAQADRDRYAADGVDRVELMRQFVAEC